MAQNIPQVLFPETFVEALEGNSVKMPCDVLKKAELHIEFVFWYKGHGRTPLYTLDARDRTLAESVHIRNETYDGRVHFYVTTEDPYLLMDKVRLEDSGIYFCRVDYQWTATQVSKVTLTAVVPSQSLTIRDGEGSLIRDVAGPYEELTDVSLICEAHKGSPSPNVTWWKNGKLLDSVYQQKGDTVVNLLKLYKLNRTDIFANFHCKAQNTKLINPTIRSVVLDLYLYPVSISIASHSSPLSTSKLTEISCETFGSRPPAVISWWLNNSRLSDHTETITGNTTKSVLRLQPKAEFHKQALSCRAENPKIRHSSVESVKVLNVTYLPQLSLRLLTEEPDRRPKEDDYIRIVCEINANPGVSDVGWFFNGSPLSNTESSMDVVNRNTLVFKRLSRSNRGRYKCYAINDEGRGMSQELLLNVSHSPVCKEHQQITYVAPLHKSVSIRCEVEAEPSEVVFKWEFTNSVQKHYDLKHTSDGLVSTATYRPLTHADYGTLFCWASNSIGHQLSSCFFTVIAPACSPESIQSNASTSKDGDENSWQYSALAVGSIISVCILFVTVVCAFYIRKVQIKKKHSNIRKILDEEIHIFNRIQVYNSDTAPHVHMVTS
ncbi:B-cell receptor CD22-like [Uloborus diversus]|uniref:B-cell receptor CD22-like n=1 Tax=Uloborus diversus TaxID=327109 RepID=UPI002409AB33|nr:B-cell receptor CD22-like [Uloborus diversus]